MSFHLLGFVLFIVTVLPNLGTCESDNLSKCNNVFIELKVRLPWSEKYARLYRVTCHLS